jgi:hypothetical protein
VSVIMDCLRSRLHEFLEQTGGTLNRQQIPLTPDSNGRVVLPANVITIRRAAWVMANGTVVPLKREDEWAIDHFIPKTWPTTTTPPPDTWPTGYSVGVTPPLTVQLAPIPTAAGTLDLIAVVEEATLNDPPTGTLLGIPDDWAWVVKFGTLAELFRRDGLGYDPERAAHCEARWRLGIQMAIKASVVLAGYINQNTALLKTLTETDQYRRTWQTTPVAVPSEILTFGWNMVALKSPPNSTVPLITLDVIANALIDCVPVDDCILDYAEYLALFKEGPSQVAGAMALYDSFVRCTGVTVELDQAAVPYRKAIFDQTQNDERAKPRIEPPGPLEKP